MDKTIGVYNPLLKDFTARYDINEDGNPESFTIPALEIGYFKPFLANHIKKHLATKILNERGVQTNWEDDYNKVLEEISK
jgi:hypothetical protein